MSKEAAAATRRAKALERLADQEMRSGREGSAAEAYALQQMADEARKEADYYKRQEQA